MKARDIKALRKFQAQLHEWREKESLHYFETLFETVEGIFFGFREVTPGAPHVLDHIEIKRYMSIVIAALIPCSLAAVLFFGFDAFRIIAEY